MVLVVDKVLYFKMLLFLLVIFVCVWYDYVVV